MATQVMAGITGLEHTVAEIVSGVRAVALNQSGTLQVAMAAVSGRMPAIGVAVGNALSGAVVSWVQVGGYQFGSGMSDYSGYLGRRVWVGRSGQIVQWSGSWNSGGFASGDIWQSVGVIANSGAVWFNAAPSLTSGGTADYLVI